MYANETKHGLIKVYPNKDAIKQMILQNRNCGTCGETLKDSTTAVLQESSHAAKALSAPKNTYGDFYILLVLLILLCDNNDSDGTLFTLILSSLFLD